VGTIFVARSKTISDWGYDVGLSKHLYKVGYTEEPVKDVVAAGWAGVTDWSLVKKQDKVDGTSDDEVVARLGEKAKMVDPKLYPKIRNAVGIFKVTPAQVENHILVKNAMAGESELKLVKPKASDFADYLIATAQANGDQG
jgi:hypothetical protein